MENINERFKEVPPKETVENIRKILQGVGIEIEETIHNAGNEYLWSVRLAAKNAFPLGSNGKGTTRELALASAYGEFIERIQCGLMFYKYQSMEKDATLNLQEYAPDGRYMTEEELIAEGDWMDHTIRTYGKGLTRKKLAEICKIYADTEDQRILTVPYYSLFEDKYVYMPAGFVEHIYASNGCCAGNTREEAWVHGLSEIMERHCCIRMLTGKQPAPVIPQSVIERYPRVAEVLQKIRENPSMDVEILDFSICEGLPVVGTKLVDKGTHNYIIGAAADPILEIALDRTVTEMFQGRTLDKLKIVHKSKIFEEASEIPVADNVLNQLENGNGLFSAEFFVGQQSRSCTNFADHSGKSNRELLDELLKIYKELGYPVYVRDYSFLGFPSYQIVIPGFSESRGFRLVEPVSAYAMGASVQKAFRDVRSVGADDLAMLLMFMKMTAGAFSRRARYGRLSGLPLQEKKNQLVSITMFTAAYRLGRWKAAKAYLKPLLNEGDLQTELSVYASCVDRYLDMKLANVSEEHILPLLKKFYDAKSFRKLEQYLRDGKTPFDDLLVSCDTVHCENCTYAEGCSYSGLSQIMERVGSHYRSFTEGQARERLSV